MKKIVLLVALFVSAICVTNAQSFNSGSRYAGLSVGVGGGYGVPISVTYEQAVADKIGVGGVIGYGSSNESYTYGKWKYSNILIGVRGNYHFLEHDQFDLYAGLILGYDIASATYKPASGYEGYDPGTVSASGLILGAQVGGRYLFNDQFAAFAELGYGLGNFSIGVTYAF